MDLKGLKEKFHEKDASFSSKFHKKDSNGKKEISTLKIIITLFFLVIITFYIGGLIVYGDTDTEEEITPELPEKFVKLVLNTETINLDENRTNFTLNGTTEAEAIINIESEELNLSNVSIKTDEKGQFKYTFEMPTSVEKASIKITAKKTGLNTTSRTIKINRNIPIEPAESAEPVSKADFKVRVSYNGEYYFEYSYLPFVSGSSKGTEGFGSNTYDIDDTVNGITLSVTGAYGGSGTLKVEILKDGSVVAQKSSSGVNPQVSIDYDYTKGQTY